MRTTKDAEDACSLVAKTFGELGGAGRHGCRAGGKIPNVERDGRLSDLTEKEIRARWLQVCEASDRAPRQLILWPHDVEHI